MFILKGLLKKNAVASDAVVSNKASPASEQPVASVSALDVPYVIPSPDLDADDAPRMRDLMDEPLLDYASPELREALGWSEYYEDKQPVFTRAEKVRAAVLAASFSLTGLSVGYMSGQFDGIKPTLPLATAAEMDESHYANRYAMQAVLLNRIAAQPVCVINLKSGKSISVFLKGHAPFGEVPLGSKEIEADRAEDVLPKCAEVIEWWGERGLGSSVYYSVNIGNAWNGLGQGFAVAERSDENGNGIPHERLPIPLGNKWYDNKAIGQLNDANENLKLLMDKFAHRDSAFSNITDRAEQALKDKFQSMVNAAANDTWTTIKGYVWSPSSAASSSQPAPR